MAVRQSSLAPTANSKSLKAHKPACSPASMFSLHPVKPSEIPDSSLLLRDAEAALESSHHWRPGKASNGIRTYSFHPAQPHSGASGSAAHSREPSSDSALQNATSTNTSTTTSPSPPCPLSPSHSWFCVAHSMPKGNWSFTNLWSQLGQDKVFTLQNYVPAMTKVTRVKYISKDQAIWTISCQLPPPLSPRVYSVYVASWLFQYSHRRRGIIVTLPVDLTSSETPQLQGIEEEGVRGRYVSIEHLAEIEGKDGERDTIEWRRITCSVAGGFIPNWLVKKWTPGELISEVGLFLKYATDQKVERMRQREKAGQRATAKQLVRSESTRSQPDFSAIDRFNGVVDNGGKSASGPPTTDLHRLQEDEEEDRKADKRYSRSWPTMRSRTRSDNSEASTTPTLTNKQKLKKKLGFGC